MKYFVLTTLLLLFGANGGEAFDMKEMMAREGKNLQKVRASSKNHEITFETFAEGGVTIEAPEDAHSPYYSTIELGGNAPLECFFYPNGIDAATSLASVTDNLLSNAHKREISIVDSGVIAHTPYIRLDVTYLVKNAQGQPLVGYLKSAIADKENGAVMCLHNSLGYKKTFTKAFELVVKTAVAPNAEQSPPPQYLEVYALVLNGQKIGYNTVKVFAANDGGDLLNNISSMLLPQPGGRVMANEDVTVEHSSKNGLVKTGSYVAISDGHVSHRIELESVDGKNFAVQGTFQGKAVNGSFQSTQGVTGGYKQTKTVKELARTGKLKTVEFDTYSPQLSPMKPLTIAYRRKSAKTNTVEMKLGPLSVLLALDKHGNTTSMDIPIGHAKLQAVSLLRVGKL